MEEAIEVLEREPPEPRAGAHVLAQDRRAAHGRSQRRMSGVGGEDARAGDPTGSPRRIRAGAAVPRRGPMRVGRRARARRSAGSHPVGRGGRAGTGAGAGPSELRLPAVVPRGPAAALDVWLDAQLPPRPTGSRGWGRWPGWVSWRPCSIWVGGTRSSRYAGRSTRGSSRATSGPSWPCTRGSSNRGCACAAARRTVWPSAPTRSWDPPRRSARSSVRPRRCSSPRPGARTRETAAALRGIDAFAELTDASPNFRALFAPIAARGLVAMGEAECAERLIPDHADARTRRHRVSLLTARAVVGGGARPHQRCALRIQTGGQPMAHARVPAGAGADAGRRRPLPAGARPAG